MGEGEGGKVPRFGGDDQLRCGCARQVRRGGTEVTPTPTLEPQVSTQQVMDEDDRFCALQVQGKALEQSVKTGNLGLPKRGAGDLRAWRGAGTWGYIRPYG